MLKLDSYCEQMGRKNSENFIEGLNISCQLSIDIQCHYNDLKLYIFTDNGDDITSLFKNCIIQLHTGGRPGIH